MPAVCAHRPSDNITEQQDGIVTMKTKQNFSSYYANLAVCPSAGAHVFSPVAGIMQCCLLMTLPTSCLMTAIRHLNKSMQHIPACSSGDAAACGSTGDSSRHRDMKAAVRRELHGTEVAPSTSQGSAGPTGKDSSEDSSKQSSSAHVAAGPKTPSGSSNRVLPEVAGDSQERAGLAACALERSDNRGATAALTQVGRYMCEHFRLCCLTITSRSTWRHERGSAHLISLETSQAFARHLHH